MLEVRSFLNEEWCKVTFMDDEVVIYEYQGSTEMIPLKNAELRFLNEIGSYYLFGRMI